ncbi:MAG: hypothetical protein KGL39_13285 [Patescibacteria group bacterium]|nr:hypothetical protein [Patescibacteria group bacterium]
MKRERRPYQTVALAVQNERRMVAYYWTRRGRKSTTLGDIYFQEMSREPGRTVINCSASLLLGKESIGMTLTAIEQAEILAAEASAVRSCIEANAAENNLQFKVANSATGKEYKQALSADNFTDLYQARAMELRLYFDKGSYSRELVLAPSIQTFRSYRALVGLDEPGYMPSAQFKDLMDSADAMMRDTPDRRMLLACNLCLEDTHPWFTITMPRDITAENEEEQFPPDANGHLYVGQTGMLVHRVALKDAYAAGHLLYDDEGKPMSYDQARQFPPMRSGWNVSYALIHKSGGASVIDIVAMITSQQRGVNGCSFVYVESDADFRRALQLLAANLTDAPVAIGADIATTTGELSNPTSVTVTEKKGNDRFERLVCVWKEKKPQVARERFQQIIRTVAARPKGGPARRFGIDASNERYFAEETADLLSSLIPVQLFIAGNSVDPRPPGYSERDGNVNYKTYAGDNYAAAINDGHYAVPSDGYVKDDHRMVMKDAGRFICIPDPGTGAHGDTFDSGKIAELMLMEGAGGAFTTESVAQLRQLNAQTPAVMRYERTRREYLNSRRQPA